MLNQKCKFYHFNENVNRELTKTVLYTDVRFFLFFISFIQNKDLNTDSKSPEGKQASKIEDVLIKVIRVIANLSINEEIGSAIASSELCVKLLINVLGKL